MALAIPQFIFPLKVPNISQLDSVDTQNVPLLNIPWTITICKENFDGEQWLAIDLYCLERGQTPNWTCPAYFAAKLKSFDEHKPSIEYQCDPYVFNQSGRGLGDKIVKWRDLFDPTKGYVKDDTIELEIKIETVEKNCNLKFDALDCDDRSMGKYQLTISNVDKLMAVQSPEIEINNSPWTLTVYKSASKELAIRLESMHRIDGQQICRMRASFKLLSFKAGENPIETVQTSLVHNGGIIESMGLISWEYLTNIQSPYAANNIITIEVKLQPDAELPVSTENSVAKRGRLECPICFERFKDQEVSSTVCGHLFCSKCIKQSMEIQKFCPSCKKPITKKNVHRVYLPL